ncbi:unnamed protein product [Arabidopsis thaliana]|uniref:Putative defensin-like protein 60 n=2 Tax=Arabidopsis thaliana TaxID=3702 RepID=DEF60_ARATH|nr:Cysteine-rich protein [Arabidopsis thaliana]Q2V4A5.1 RecName: Full=Putative defensin-like protein 60; Flags: Precursor [Arabidopsis thaliana]AEC05774.1 Cysteine-rich protein [Arabidopsis thaliana]VYS51976.1 unnamed protein product [Arabidopsis thaliana]|eukprot:NP_001031314.1 Cysteine-rich protein [Arabidopsis thaliana]
MKMNITKSYVILFLVVVMTNSLSNSEVLVAPVIETAQNDVCFVPCTSRYGHYECAFDCMHKRYKDGGCVHGRCCCKT